VFAADQADRAGENIGKGEKRDVRGKYNAECRPIKSMTSFACVARQNPKIGKLAFK